MVDVTRQEVERVIEHFDLGEYEIDAYLAVLRYGTLTASEVSERTDVPQPRVYDTVRALADDGLVELQEARPMRVVAVDPREAFAEVQQELAELVDALTETYTEPARETEAVTLVKSRLTILRYLEETIELAEYELAVALPPGLLERYADELAAAVDRGVAVDLLVSPAEGAPSPETYDYAAVSTEARARRGVTTPVIVVADGRYSVYTTRDALWENGDDRYGMILNRSVLGFLIYGFYATVLWSTSQALSENYGRPEYPRRYASVRRCVRDLRRAEGSFVANVAGRNVVDGEDLVLEGRIVDFATDADSRVASITVETGDGRVEVGGRVATYEDVEVHRIEVRREGA